MSEMTIAEINKYLQIKNKESFDGNVAIELERLKEEAIAAKNELTANTCWCYKKIFHIQEKYVIIFNYLKNKKYEDAWNLLEQVEIAIGTLIENFDIGPEWTDPYQINFIKYEIKQFIRLFPYKLFASREEIIKEEVCSICGKKVTLRNSCGHKPGKLYMGQLCTRTVTDFELVGIALVNDPFDMYAFLKPKDPSFRYNYGVIDTTMNTLTSPYDKWYVDIFPILRKEFNRDIGRNEPCPCGSGKKFKKCCMGTEHMYTEHYQINHFGPDAKDIPFMYV